MTDVPFKVGDRVKKRSGYEYPGFIVSVFTNRAGAVRYVVEADHPAFSGMLHIFNGDACLLRVKDGSGSLERHVRSTVKSRHRQATPARPFRAIRRHGGGSQTGLAIADCPCVARWDIRA